MLRFLKTTVVGGLLFILPLLLIGVLVEKAVHLLRPAIAKLLPMFPDHAIAGVTLFSLLALVALLLICFLAGLLARTRFARQLLEPLENGILANIPGYQLVKDTASRVAGLDNEEGLVVGLLEDDGRYVFCVTRDEPRDGMIAVYRPDAGPAGGTAGELLFVPAESFIRTDLTWLQVLTCLRRCGLGALVLAEPWLPPAATPARD
ncbi:hypothetical protein JQX08_12135 [Pseudomonas sp. UL073]|uniref:DUF502 domain-containing protein n=1 Tax=Zestomonas insulae TaxID=2809017 RepID=A0ABS2IGJ3_9GAMM|nr:hypothetical protein [Pseudomonas insulae]MBM7061454.1 hypothetical protein [Pseudomonas insulae]